VVTGRAEPGGHQEGAELVAVEVSDVRLIVDPGAADVDSGGVFDDAFLFGVAVEPDDRAQPSSDRRAGTAGVLEVPGEALDVDAVDVEQATVVLPAPSGELAQIQRVGVTGEPAVAGQEPKDGRPLHLGEHGLVPLERGRGCGHGGTSPIEAGATDHNATGVPDR
jgi:hypothetical protein